MLCASHNSSLNCLRLMKIMLWYLSCRMLFWILMILASNFAGTTLDNSNPFILSSAARKIATRSSSIPYKKVISCKRHLTRILLSSYQMPVQPLPFGTICLGLLRSCVNHYQLCPDYPPTRQFLASTRGDKCRILRNLPGYAQPWHPDTGRVEQRISAILAQRKLTFPVRLLRM